MVEKSGLYHYLSTAKSNYHEYLNGEIYDYLDRTIEEVEKVIAELCNKETGSWEELNQIFLKLI